MSKTQDIRDALASGPLSFRDLHLKIGGDDKKLNDLCCYLRGKGEVKLAKDDDRTVALTGRRPPQGRIARSGKKPAVKKGKRVKRPYKRLAEKHAGKSNGADLHALAVENFLAAGEQLTRAVREGVEGIEDNPELFTALANHDRAARLLAAALQ